MVAQFRQGVDPRPMLLWDTARTAYFITETSGNSALQDDLYFGSCLDTNDVPDASEFIDAYTEYFGTAPGAFAVNAAAAGGALFAAIETAGSTDSTAILAALRSNPFDTALGTVGFDSFGDITGSASEYKIYEIESDAFVLWEASVE